MSYTGVVPVPKATSFLSHGTLNTDSQTITIARGYRPGYIRVYLNGAFLPPDQYTATDGSTIDFGEVMPAGTDWIVDEARTFIPAEFGNAALRDVGLDPGNIMEVGAFGAGQTSVNDYAGSLNNLTTGGTYGVYCASATETPAGLDGSSYVLTVTVEVRDQSYITQTATATRHSLAGRRWVRVKVGATWEPWREIAHSGMAPEFAGMPTVGGTPIVETGSNTDGEWTRWSDGTQRTAFFHKGASSSFTHTYPISYIEAPKVLCTVWSTQAYFGVHDTPSNTYVVMRTFAASGAAATPWSSVCTFGRWK